MKRFVMYRRNVPTDTHNENQRNAPDEPQFEGVVFDDGKVVVHWLTAVKSISVWDSMDDLLKIHGHPEYDSVLDFMPEDNECLNEILERVKRIENRIRS